MTAAIIPPDTQPPAVDGGAPARQRWHRFVPMLPALLPALPIALVFAGLAAAWTTPAPDVWAHLREHVLPRALADTGRLLVVVGLACAVIGVACAWLNARCDYPGRRGFDWALLLPLALPSYVVAFVCVGLFDYAGPLQSGWRELSGARGALWQPHGWAWAAAVLTLCFYPYVYLTVRAVLLRQGDRHDEVARSLGAGAWRRFARVRLPLLRPALMAGLGLVLLETLAEFGAVSLLGVETLTTTVYRTWFGQFALPAAAQLAGIGLLLVAVLLLLEARARRHQRHHGEVLPVPRRRRLSPRAAVVAITLQSLLLGLAFVAPLAQLLVWAFGTAEPTRSHGPALVNTLLLAAIAATVLVGAALALVAWRRRHPTPLVRAPLAVATLGYGIPGTVLAVGLVLSLLATESWLAARALPAPALASGLVVLLLALFARFLRAAVDPIDAGFAQLRPTLFEAARSLGAGPARRWRAVVVPLLRPTVLGAALLVAIEVMKELPATLMLRPLGWDTLAVRIHALAAEGLWREAAWPALILVAAGLLPVWLLVRLQGGDRSTPRPRPPL